MNARELLFAQGTGIPDLGGRRYRFAGKFLFWHGPGRPFVIGGRYENRMRMKLFKPATFHLLVEAFPVGSAPDLSTYESKELGETTVYLGYRELFQVTRSEIGMQRPVSWRTQDKVYSLAVELGAIPKRDQTLSRFLPHLSAASSTIGEESLLDFLDFLPVTLGGASLARIDLLTTTPILTRTVVHAIVSLAAHYEKDAHLTRVELRFACGCPDFLSAQYLYPDAGLVDLSAGQIAGRPVVVLEREGHPVALASVNEERRCSIVVGTLAASSSSPFVRSTANDLMEGLLEALDDYRCADHVCR